MFSKHKKIVLIHLSLYEEYKKAKASSFGFNFLWSINIAYSWIDESGSINGWPDLKPFSASILKSKSNELFFTSIL